MTPLLVAIEEGQINLHYGRSANTFQRRSVTNDLGVIH